MVVASDVESVDAASEGAAIFKFLPSCSGGV